MRNRLRRSALSLVTLLAALAPVAPALAHHAQPAFQPGQMDYTPIGHYGPGGTSPTIPSPSGGAPAVGPNPSGKWVAYDTNVWESLAVPYRHPNDNCNSLANEDKDPHCRSGDEDPDNDTNPAALTGYTGYQGPNGTSPMHGTCPPSPDEGFGPWGQCFNNQLEYLDYFEHSMETMLADFGVTVHRYGFHSPGTGSRGVYLDASGGQAYNIAAVVPGTDHPEETVLVSGHYDFTDSGPAAAWDSAEGHTEVMRIAWIMANYWRQTGTGPSATVKFIPWDSEESGTHGSRDYVNNNIPPGEEDKVRGYFNMDPCAGAYPAYKDGTEQRVQQVLQLADPAPFAETDPAAYERILRFNQRAARDQQGKEGETQYYSGPDIIDDVFERLDDTITRVGGSTEPIFVSDSEGTEADPSQRGEVVTALGGLAAFSSDYANFEALGIPIFNFFPDLFGPHADLTPASAEGVTILHTNNDNLTRINRLTTGLTTPGNVVDATGTFASEGWAKGQEMCAQTEATYMLQPEMVGTQTANLDPVAYFEALPNEAVKGQNVSFDGSGSHRITQLNPRQSSDSNLSYAWTFGDGATGTGKTVQHAYPEVGRYTATLTVTNTLNSQTDTMSIPIEVVPSDFAPPALEALPAEDADGTIDLAWDFTADRDGFANFSVEESKDLTTLFADDAEGTPEDRWTVGQEPGTAAVEPWQPSDSGTTKFRGNQKRSGARSFWTGVSPNDFNPGPASERSILTMKTPIDVPAGDPELSFWSIFQSEGDDQGRVEVALTDDDPATPLEWQALEVIQAVNTAAGQDDFRVCDPSNPSTLQRDFFNTTASLAAYRGKRILLRFVYSLGAENRALSQPCGWYVDDIRLSAGTWSQVGTTGEETFSVTRGPGTYGYRVVAQYADGVRSAPSNTEVTKVPGEATAGGTPSTAGGPGAGTPDANASGGAVSILRRPATLRGERYVSVKLRCPTTSKSDCKGVLRLYTARAVKRAGSSGRLRLGAKRYVVAPGRVGTVRVRLPLKARKYVRKRRSVRVLAVSVPDGGKGVDRETFTLVVPRGRG